MSELTKEQEFSELAKNHISTFTEMKSNEKDKFKQNLIFSTSLEENKEDGLYYVKTEALGKNGEAVDSRLSVFNSKERSEVLDFAYYLKSSIPTEIKDQWVFNI